MSTSPSGLKTKDEISTRLTRRSEINETTYSKPSKELVNTFLLEVSVCSTVIIYITNKKGPVNEAGEIHR